MALTEGTRLGPYEIQSPLGSGGMGEVYRARDTRLKRDVAIKVLPEAFSQDPERLARFQREAEVLAALNHPNIAAVYGLEKAAGITGIVLELVDGETLAELIACGPIAWNDAQPIALQIAEALLAAHEQGIVHRDLKPANVKLRPDGAVKVLDFGLAKAMDAAPPGGDAGLSPTLSSPAATRAGVILGTAAYMSPEQARGRAVDKRTDVWAFGCVLYEMLTGVRAFEGEDVTDVIAAIIRSEPALGKLPAETPPPIRRLVRRCLEKDRKERLPDMGTARLEIKDAMTPAEQAPAAAAPVVQPQKRRSARFAWFLAAVFMVLALALGATIYLRQPPADTAVYRASILPPETAAWATVTPATRFTLSPDGRRLAFIATDTTGRTQLWVRSLDGLGAQPLSGTENTVVAFWSADSRYLAFGSAGKLRKIDASGGPPLTLADMNSNNGGSWNQDNVILFPPTALAPLQRVSAAGGASAPVTAFDPQSGDARHWQPFFLPDRRHFLYHVVGSKAGPNDARATYVGSLDPAEKSKMLIAGGSNAQYASGYVLFLRDATLMAQPFDLKRLELTGEARPIAEQIQLGGATGRTGAFSVSQTGVLAYQTGAGETQMQLTWFDRSGKALGILGNRADYGDLSLSRDGKRASVELLDAAHRTRDIWLFDLMRGLRTRFTFDPTDELASVWSADASRVVFNSNRSGHFDLYQKASNGTGNDEVLLADNFEKFPLSWSSDDRFMLYMIAASGSPTKSNDLWVLPLTGDRKPFPYLHSPFGEAEGQFSSDGKWVAYVSNESGRNEVYVAPFPEARGKWQVSTTGGANPRWRPDGKEIFYRAPDNKLMAAELNVAGSAVQVGAVRPLFDMRTRTNARYMYDTADGQRFLINTLVEEATPTPITLIVNWPALLRK